MVLLKFKRLIIVIVTMVPGLESKKSAPPMEDAVICNKLIKEPYFDVEMVLGRPWRIYFSWNMNLENKCMDMVFRNATPEIISRIYNDMNDYLETEPYWDAATLLVSMGRASHELLLFADQGAAGRFQGVPNVIRDGNITPSKKTVPLLKFQMKLMFGGKYLLMADCQIGVSTLSVRKNVMPYRAEIGGIAANLDFGPGLHACLSDKNKNEILPKE